MSIPLEGLSYWGSPTWLVLYPAEVDALKKDGLGEFEADLSAKSS